MKRLPVRRGSIISKRQWLRRGLRMLLTEQLHDDNISHQKLKRMLRGTNQALTLDKKIKVVFG